MSGSGATESSLGRYLPGDDGPLVEVRLLGLPVPLFIASREHHDGLVRELRLLALEDDAGELDVPARLVELVDSLGTRHATARSRRDTELEAAHARGERTIDLVEHVPSGVVEVAERLRTLIEECDRFCREGQLMTLPRPPLVRQLSEWYLAQFRDQVQGRAPTRWDGPSELTQGPG
ncbi:hypothetical protein [Aquipuribacter sp. MA13-6]|uniref:hypothetical protein n=1 Tax=unclassified Aquipuribacter TaxID=2635084 RepID=UPI003EF01E1C